MLHDRVLLKQSQDKTNLACPNCHHPMTVGIFDYMLWGLNPDCVRHAVCFVCDATIYQSGRISCL